MRKRLPVWLLLAVMTASAPIARAQSCPADIHLANNASTADGMRSNGGFITFHLASSMATGSGRTCTYTRPNDPNYDPFIGRNLAPDEVGSTPSGSNAWQVATAGGGSRTVTCPAHVEIGPVALYTPAGGSLTPIPGNWLVTQNNVQSLSFDTRGSQAPFRLRCNYRGYGNVVMYVPPPARSFSAASCAGLYAAGASLSARLASCPGLDDLLLWEDGAGNVFSHSGYSYPAWTAAQRPAWTSSSRGCRTGTPISGWTVRTRRPIYGPPGRPTPAPAIRCAANSCSNSSSRRIRPSTPTPPRSPGPSISRSTTACPGRC